MQQFIRVRGARVHNLKNISLDLPRDSLIVISGLSGSGKSSLAFDTIFAEGQRRYVESLSAYARQFLGLMEKPDVDSIDGLSPSISIEQKTTSRNPRSTVATTTEIYDYFRLLFARTGIPHDPVSGKPIEKQTIDQMIDIIMAFPAETKLTILSPVIRGKKGWHQKVFEDAKNAGYQRVRVNGTIRDLDESIELERQQKHNVDIVVDRVLVRPENRQRIAEGLESALEMAGGVAGVACEHADTTWEQNFSEKYFFPDSTLVFPDLEPSLFSFNTPFGACPDCSGLGITLEFDKNLIMPDSTLSFNEGGLVPYNPSAAWNRSKFEALSKHYDFSLDTALCDLPKHIMNIIFNGTSESIEVTYINKSQTGKFEFNSPWEGIQRDLQRRYRESTSSGVKEWLESFMAQQPCQTCMGRRLRSEALSVLVAGKDIHAVTTMSVRAGRDFFDSVNLSGNAMDIAKPILKEIKARLGFLVDVGLGYLTLDRATGTLSGGEAQRIRLATQIGSALVGVLYVLDEPSIGLHQRDNERLIKTLLHLKSLGNTLIVVEHDEQTLRTADWIVDLGPGAGIHGGNIVAAGTTEQILANHDSITGNYLAGRIAMSIPLERRPGNGKFIQISGASEHNLKNIDVELPLGKLVAITGVSGSGKSSLLSDIVYPAASNKIFRTSYTVGKHASITGLEHIDKIINIDQSPIGRTPRSNPATYVGVFGPIRDLFAALPESKARGYKPGRFSFNVKGGRCEQCEGAGTIKIEMHFLPDVYVNCDSCHGKRFNRETLDIHFKGKSIHHVLEMSIEEANDFFTAIPAIRNKLETLCAVGLGYVKLGQSALTLSGGEAQRVKLALELSKRSTGKTLYILDEPTTGLHFADVKKLMEVLQALMQKGNSIILIEHNLDVIAQSDWVIDLGPEGGDEGGMVIAVGTPEAIANNQQSHTGRFLKPMISR